MQNGDRIPVYVAAYQKSGSTWLTRLLGDALNSPTGGSVPGQDHREPASEGHDRPGKFIIRKGHYKIARGIDTNINNAVTKKHEIHLPALKHEERVIFLVRDPRDIAVSGSFYFNISVQDALKQMHTGTGKFRYLGPWAKYVDFWIVSSDFYYQINVIRYEDLLLDKWETLNRIIEVIDRNAKDENRMRAAVIRNSFKNTKKRVEREGYDMPLGMAQNRKLVRKGIVGDWRNHFTEEMEKNCQAWFGKTMKRLGYV